MAEALAGVKRRFGADALILSTRALEKGGPFGIVGTPRVEITATRALERLPEASAPARVRPKRDATQDAREVGRGDFKRADGAASAVSETSTSSAVPAHADLLLSEVGSLRSLVSDLVQETRLSRTRHLPGALYDAYQQLLANEVAEKLALDIVDRVRQDLGADRLHDRNAVRGRLAGLLQAMLPTSGPIRVRGGGGPALIALIGPTGVGKTTTVAKLAANFRLREQRRVGLITLDTYRIAAVEQLRTYAQIIDVPLHVANSPEQYKEAVASLADCEVVLVDTAGRSQRDSQKIADLQGFFRAVNPDELHLVLSGNAGASVLNETIERFSVFAIDRMIFTKLDEAIGFGVILNCLQKANGKLSYVTTGQDVPDDIRVGESKALAGLIMRGGPAARMAAGEGRPCRGG